MEKQRLTALKTRIEPVISGTYVRKDGFEPNYVKADGRQLSRVRVMGTVVANFTTPKISSVTIDDGTGTIRAKAFNSLMLESYKPGDVVEVMGKVRESQDEEIFMIPETVRRIEDMNWLILRELELRELDKKHGEKRKVIDEIKKEASDVEELKALSKERGIKEEEVEALVGDKDEDEKEEETDSSSRQKVLKIIEENDSGEGCDYSVLIDKSDLEEERLDRTISEILEDGICFEPKPGKIKKL